MRTARWLLRSVCPSFFAVSCAAAPHASAPTPAREPIALTAQSVALPGASAPASLDYIVYESAGGRVWVPVGNTGSVDVFDPARGAFTRVDGFKTDEREVRGAKRTIGPSAATVGEGAVYVGNRATREVCAVDAKALRLGACAKVGGDTDGVAYVASVKELWVTTPDEKSITVLDVSNPGAPAAKSVIAFAGEPEGYAVDEARGLFFTNLEDAGGTVVVDVKTHTVKATWQAGCGENGPRGLAFDAARGFLFVACTDHVQVLDTRHDGAHLGRLETGNGVDNIDWLDAKQLLYTAAAKDARLTVARVDDAGRATIIATGTTALGARNPVADAKGNAYVADGRGARLLIFAMP